MLQINRSLPLSTAELNIRVGVTYGDTKLENNTSLQSNVEEFYNFPEAFMKEYLYSNKVYGEKKMLLVGGELGT